MLEQIRDMLMPHIGKKNPITSKEISKKIGVIEDDTHTKTRYLILQCAYEYGLPLAANSNGYFLIESAEEYEEYINNLDFRIAGIEERKRIITENFNRNSVLPA
jgi:hypothetical protein